VSYLVFARKYRPQTFDEVVGQGHVARTLKNAMEGDRLAHAYLFAGPRGVGKTTVARILAKAVNCLESPGVSPCGTCETCTGIAAGSDVDVMEIDAASNRKVEDVEPLIDSTRYLPQRARRKVFIVDETHMLSRHAWNALLKTLEEPPPHVLFVFATTEPHKIPETVRSRCQRFDFRRISEADISGKLRRIAGAENVQVEESVFEEIAARATGGLRDAESLFDQALSAAPPDRPLASADLLAILGGIPIEMRRGLLDLARAGDMQGVLRAATEVVDAGADPAELLRELYGDLREAAVRAATGGENGPGVEWCLAAAEIVARHQRLASDSRAVRATLDLALLSVARLGEVVDLERIAERLESLVAGGAAPASRESATPRPERAPPPVQPPPPQRPFLRPRTSDEEPQAALEAQSRPEQNEPSRPVRDEPLSGEQLARIRGNPRVREILKTFGGKIEQVRRIQNGG
jgi:DNA polymerase-3 subunit gamma/tau